MVVVEDQQRLALAGPGGQLVDQGRDQRLERGGRGGPSSGPTRPPSRGAPSPARPPRGARTGPDRCPPCPATARPPAAAAPGPVSQQHRLAVPGRGADQHEPPPQTLIEPFRQPRARTKPGRGPGTCSLVASRTSRSVAAAPDAAARDSAIANALRSGDPPPPCSKNPPGAVCLPPRTSAVYETYYPRHSRLKPPPRHLAGGISVPRCRHARFRPLGAPSGDARSAGPSSCSPAWARATSSGKVVIPLAPRRPLPRQANPEGPRGKRPAADHRRGDRRAADLPVRVLPLAPAGHWACHVHRPGGGVRIGRGAPAVAAPPGRPVTGGPAAWAATTSDLGPRKIGDTAKGSWRASAPDQP